MGDWPNEGRLSALNIRRACDASLRRLRTDYVDLYQMHHVDRDTPWDEIWQAMEVLTAQVEVLYAGSSNFAGWHIARLRDGAGPQPRRPGQRAVTPQPRHPLDRAGGAAAAREHGVGVIPWSPLEGGLLGEAPAHVALGITLDGAVLTRIDEIFPGYKTAPEHYAW